MGGFGRGEGAVLFLLIVGGKGALGVRLEGCFLIGEKDVFFCQNWLFWKGLCCFGKAHLVGLTSCTGWIAWLSLI